MKLTQKQELGTPSTVTQNKSMVSSYDLCNDRCISLVQQINLFWCIGLRLFLFAYSYLPLHVSFLLSLSLSLISSHMHMMMVSLAYDNGLTCLWWGSHLLMMRVVSLAYDDGGLTCLWWWSHLLMEMVSLAYEDALTWVWWWSHLHMMMVSAFCIQLHAWSIIRSKWYYYNMQVTPSL